MSRSTCRAPDRTESVTAAGETDYGEKEQSQSLADYSFSTEKPLVSSRLIGRRKSLKATPEGGRTLRVSRPKRNDTLESTWRAITDGRAMPLTRHLKKSDTWETTERDGDRGARRPPLSSGAAARLRKEPSIGQDDLNRRVEAFINKFNQEMKLQRQESFKHYFDMINRGSH
ncbi:uncharacterized protein A4U43_C07F39470 [Asparagus officinalis]|uniref:DUF4408 domain-containing protein n=1 Tax=Asparagus officinalis TaxID=4686 RepID=A0A5P1ENQ9_ASPOF|nr:uncharacterized protein LOC109850171 [Asparagus officinalis]ONK65670.1 uncharacterized protein A4U43_C07F39470 [Asparagus officinalis]